MPLVKTKLIKNLITTASDEAKFVYLRSPTWNSDELPIHSKLFEAVV